MGQKITDKRLKDQRFRKTEEAITEVFFSSKRILSARVIAKRARISRSTLYRHHGSVYEILPDYEEYILEKYSRLMRGLLRRKGIRMKTLYYQMLIFMMKNKDIFKMIIERGSGSVVEEMVQGMGTKIVEVYKLPKNHEKMLAIYEKEIVGVLERWVKNDFKSDEMSVLDDIMYLTETLRSRLIPLVG